MAFRMVALDLDGTLLDSQRVIRDDTAAAVRALRARGLLVMMVTGRHHAAARAYHLQLELDSPIICCNGTYVYDYAVNRVLAADPLDKNEALALVALSRRHGAHNWVYVEDAMTFERENEHVRGLLAWQAGLPAGMPRPLRRVDRFEAEIARSDIVWKVVASHPDIGALNACVAAMQAEVPASYEWSWHDRVDIARASNTKGGRLADWLASNGIGLDEVLAIGDGHNDISMLARAGMGVAMANSPDEVKSAADWVTGDNDNGGVVAALRRFVL
jgi:Cof subfamily protein (haloacid dehalogenase superfamily)